MEENPQIPATCPCENLNRFYRFSDYRFSRPTIWREKIAM